MEKLSYKNIEKNCFIVMKGKDEISDDTSVEESAYYWKGEPKIFWPKEKHDPHKPTAIDLFCGMGGLSIGFEMAGFDVMLGADIHKPSIETFRNSHSKAIAILGDITTIIDSGKGEKLLEHFRKVSGKEYPDVLMAGIPCQGFSLSNRKRSDKDKRNFLFTYFMKAVDIFKPKFVLIENVRGLKSMKDGSFVKAIESEIKTRGFKVDHKLLNAADFGVPQKRVRIIFLGASSGYSIIWPEPKFGTRAKPYRTVRDAISDLPPLMPGEQTATYETKNESQLTEYQKLMMEGSTALKSHKAPRHPKGTIERIRKTEQGKPMYPSFKQRIRLSWDSPSPTQICGGIRPQFQFGHPDQARGLTVRERARIQSIPDIVEISGGVVQGRVQTGNAVPPLLAKSVGECVIRSLKGEKEVIKAQSFIRDLRTFSKHA